MKRMLLICGLMALPALSFAETFQAGDMVIEDPFVRATTAMAMTGAGYFVVRNEGTQDDTLLEISANFPRVMMHDTKVEDSVATMFHLDEGVVVPAGGSVTFAQGGKHVMFMGLGGDPFEIGEEIPATVTFEKAGPVEIRFAVKDIAE